MKIKVWDIPTRLFHWLLVLAVFFALYTASNEAFLEYHTIAGYLAAGLAVFRVLWGFAGGRYSHFTRFVKGWGEVRSFLRGALRLRPDRYLGHNPAVGWVVLLMLAIVLTLGATGVITYGGEENKGLWAGAFTFELGMRARDVHEFLAYFAIAVIVIHVGAALFHDLILRENIILSMITGTKEDQQSWSERFEKEERAGAPLHVLRSVTWMVVAVLAGLAMLYLPPKGGSDISKLKEPRVLDGRGFLVRIKPDPVWRSECATSCHGAFHPTLLPAESWKRIISGLDDHFGDSAGVDEQSKNRILSYLLAASSDRSVTEASKKLLYSIPKGEVPLRITEVPYWADKHSEIDPDVYARKSITSKSNCKACHPGADLGSFEDKDISVPEQ